MHDLVKVKKNSGATSNSSRVYSHMGLILDSILINLRSYIWTGNLIWVNCIKKWSTKKTKNVENVLEDQLKMYCQQEKIYQVWLRRWLVASEFVLVSLRGW